MTTVNAAVVTSFDAPPHYQPFDMPAPVGPEQSLIEVVAVGLHPRVRSGASGSHYTSTDTLPMVPGVDAVGRRDDGTLIYFVAADDVIGTMAERAIADRRRSIELPAGIAAPAVAAAMNPSMSSWVALRRRVPLQPGQSVLVLGATGNAGTMAVQVAKRLGAGRVIGAGRNAVRLAALRALGADETVALVDDPDASASALAAVAAEVDVVVDYLWGATTQAAIPAVLRARDDRSRTLDWIQIGSITGPDIMLPSVALRSANLRLQGSGQGSVSPRLYLAELPSLVNEIAAGTFAITPRVRPLSEVTDAWVAADAPGERTVLVP